MSGRRRPHRGAVAHSVRFAQHFLRARIDGVQKDIGICLTGVASRTDPGQHTHAYFPALAACFGMLEYAAGLERGNLKSVGWPDIVRWAREYLPQNDYTEDVTRIAFLAMRNTIAHHGIANGVWIDPQPGPGHNRRFTWKVFANSRRPAIRLVEENGTLIKDPPWECRYTHRIHVHLRAFWVDIRKGIEKHSRQLKADQALLARFNRCMNQLYPR